MLPFLVGYVLRDFVSCFKQPWSSHPWKQRRSIGTFGMFRSTSMLECHSFLVVSSLARSLDTTNTELPRDHPNGLHLLSAINSTTCWRLQTYPVGSYWDYQIRGGQVAVNDSNGTFWQHLQYTWDNLSHLLDKTKDDLDKEAEPKSCTRSPYKSWLVVQYQWCPGSWWQSEQYLYKYLFLSPWT